MKKKFLSTGLALCMVSSFSFAAENYADDKNDTLITYPVCVTETTLMGGAIAATVLVITTALLSRTCRKTAAAVQATLSIGDIVKSTYEVSINAGVLPATLRFGDRIPREVLLSNMMAYADFAEAATKALGGSVPSALKAIVIRISA